MCLNREQEQELLQKPFEISDISIHFSDDKIKGYYLKIFLKDEKAVDDFAKWFKKEILKINI